MFLERGMARKNSGMSAETSGEILPSEKDKPKPKPKPELRVLSGGKETKKETKPDFVKRDAKELAELLSAFVKIDGEKSSVMEAETLYKQLRERAQAKEYADKDAVEQNNGLVLDTEQIMAIKFNDLGEEKTATFSLTVNTDRADKNYGHYDLVPQYGDKNAARAAGIRD